jgi:hypothetical protein
MRHVLSFLALGIYSAQIVPLTRATADPQGVIRPPDFTFDAGGPVISLAYNLDGNTLTSEDARHSVALWDVKKGIRWESRPPARLRTLTRMERKPHRSRALRSGCWKTVPGVCWQRCLLIRARFAR